MLADRVELLLPAYRRAREWHGNDNADAIKGERKVSRDAIRATRYRTYQVLPNCVRTHSDKVPGWSSSALENIPSTTCATAPTWQLAIVI